MNAASTAPLLTLPTPQNCFATLLNPNGFIDYFALAILVPTFRKSQLRNQCVPSPPVVKHLSPCHIGAPPGAASRALPPARGAPHPPPPAPGGTAPWCTHPGASAAAATPRRDSHSALPRACCASFLPSFSPRSSKSRQASAPCGAGTRTLSMYSYCTKLT